MPGRLLVDWFSVSGVTHMEGGLTVHRPASTLRPIAPSVPPSRSCSLFSLISVTFCLLIFLLWIFPRVFPEFKALRLAGKPVPGSFTSGWLCRGQAAVLGVSIWAFSRGCPASPGSGPLISDAGVCVLAASAAGRLGRGGAALARGIDCFTGDPASSSAGLRRRGGWRLMLGASRGVQAWASLESRCLCSLPLPGFWGADQLPAAPGAPLPHFARPSPLALLFLHL